MKHPQLHISPRADVPSYAASAPPSPPTPLTKLLDESFQDYPSLDAKEAVTLPRRVWERALLGPARDFLSRPGKAFRGRLVESAWELAGGEAGAMPPELPHLVEILHAGSLIIDDIEDQSLERRGHPALHHLYGTALALNTGNWMYYWSQALLARLSLSDSTRLSLFQEMSLTMLRCHQGQALDLGIRLFELSPSEIRHVVTATTRLKTGSLMRFAAGLGGIAAGANEADTKTLLSFGSDLGTALQMLDDASGILSPTLRHKGREDLNLSRCTWPWAWLADELPRVTLKRLLAEARHAHASKEPALVMGQLQERLSNVAPTRVRAQLDSALEPLVDRFSGHPAVAAIRAEVSRLEKSYV